MRATSRLEQRAALDGVGPVRIAENPVGRHRTNPVGPESAAIEGSGSVQPDSRCSVRTAGGRWPASVTSRYVRRARPHRALVPDRPGPRPRRRRIGARPAAALPRYPRGPRRSPGPEGGSGRADDLDQGGGEHLVVEAEGPGKVGVLATCPERHCGRPPRPNPGHRRCGDSASAMRVSVSSGRCGPCCSSEPTGTASTRLRSATATSVHVASANARRVPAARPQARAVVRKRIGVGTGRATPSDLGVAEGRGVGAPRARAPPHRGRTRTQGRARRGAGRCRTLRPCSRRGTRRRSRRTHMPPRSGARART